MTITHKNQLHHLHHLPKAALAVLAAAVLAGCSSTPLDENKAPVESRAANTVPNSNSASSGAAPQSRVVPVDLSKTDNMALGNMPKLVYFDFDSFVVKEEFRPTVESNAKVLGADRKRKVAIEGHTDERGGREYNLALGQKRSEAVSKSLALLGVNDNQMEAVSFGKERPAVQGSDEAAWAKNRRAELVYR